MKPFAIYGREFGEEHNSRIIEFFEYLDSKGAKYAIYEPFAKFLQSQIGLSDQIEVYSKPSFDASKYEIMLSIGGDGTMLDTTTIIKNSKLPILGLNTGRLGFLSKPPERSFCIERRRRPRAGGTQEIESRDHTFCDRFQNVYHPRDPHQRTNHSQLVLESRYRERHRGAFCCSIYQLAKGR